MTPATPTDTRNDDIAEMRKKLISHERAVAKREAELGTLTQLDGLSAYAGQKIRSGESTLEEIRERVARLRKEIERHSSAAQKIRVLLLERQLAGWKQKESALRQELREMQEDPDGWMWSHRLAAHEFAARRCAIDQELQDISRTMEGIRCTLVFFKR